MLWPLFRQDSERYGQVWIETATAFNVRIINVPCGMMIPMSSLCSVHNMSDYV